MIEAQLLPSKAVAPRMTKLLSVFQVRTSPGFVASSVIRARLEIDSIHIESLAIAQVQGDENKLRIAQDQVRTFCARTPRKGVRSRTV